MHYQLGFLGAGNMAEAIARAAMDANVLAASQMIASDPAEARRAVFAKLGIAVTSDNAEVIGQSAQIMLAVKPQMMKPVAADLARFGSEEQVIISIMAGVTVAKLSAAMAEAATPSPNPNPESRIPSPAPRIIRVMPNTPMMVGQGMAGIAVGPGVGDADAQLTMKLFAAGGKAVRVEEALIDAITAVSGSGPAYVFYLAEAMQQAATDLGLGEHARLLVGQTLLGAATLLMNSPDTPAELRRKVTSPGGTTEAAIKHLDANQVKQVWTDAVKMAEKRSKELGK